MTRVLAIGVDERPVASASPMSRPTEGRIECDVVVNAGGMYA